MARKNLGPIPNFFPSISSTKDARVTIDMPPISIKTTRTTLPNIVYVSLIFGKTDSPVTQDAEVEINKLSRKELSTLSFIDIGNDKRIDPISIVIKNEKIITIYGEM